MSTLDRGVLGIQKNLDYTKELRFLVACCMASYKLALELHHTEVKPLLCVPRVLSRVFTAPWHPGQRWGWELHSLTSEVTASLSLSSEREGINTKLFNRLGIH